MALLVGPLSVLCNAGSCWAQNEVCSWPRTDFDRKLYKFRKVERKGFDFSGKMRYDKTVVALTDVKNTIISLSLL